MKTLKLLTFLLTFVGWSQLAAQGCDAAGGAYLTNTPGTVSILDSSTTASGPNGTYSWINFYDSTGNLAGTVYLQPSTNFSNYTFNSNGTYTYSLNVWDSITNCNDSLMGTFTISGLNSTYCNANYTYTIGSGGMVSFDAPSQVGSGHQYYWDFGDGNVSYTSNPSHTFTAAGNYTVCLTVWSGNFCSDTICKTVSISNINPPSGNCDASFSYWVDSIQCNNVWFYINQSSSYQYYWSFGDGGSSNSQNPTHNYASNGVYTVELAVYKYDSLGIFVCADTTTQLITINCNNGPSCDASAVLIDSAGYLYGVPNTYNANYDYYWDFGDGNTSTLVYPWHQYSTPGTYYVCLTVIDSAAGCSDTQCYYFTVSAPNSCNAYFYLFQDSLNTGTYYAWNMSTGNNLTYHWDFGDGNTSSSAYPVHVYTTPGIYSLCLTVSNGSGCTSTFCDTINVVVKSNGTTLGVSPPGQFASVEDADVIESLKLYPNPNNGFFSLEIGLLNNADLTITVSNYVGQVVHLSNQELTAGQVTLTMDISQYPSGVYILTVQNVANGLSKNLRLIKE